MAPGTSGTRMALATAMCLVVHAGCEEVEGGAVELSWKLRPASSGLEDKFVECNSRKAGTGPVTRIRLDWIVGDQAGFADWDCTENKGATGFELPEGEALLTVTPVCSDGVAETRSYISPAPEQRTVNLGDTISLGAVEMVVTVTECGSAETDGQCCICGLRSVTGCGNEMAHRLPLQAP